MLTIFARWFKAPIFLDDEDKTRRALLLNIVLNTFLIALPVLILGVLLGGPFPRFERTITIITCGWLTIFGTRQIMLSGQVALAGIMTVFVIFVSTTLTIYNLGTIRAPATSFYILAVVMSGLTISRRAIVPAAGLSAIAVMMLMLGEAKGLLPEPNLSITITQGITFTVVLAIISILLYLAVQSIDEALTRVRQELTERQHAENRLETIHEIDRDLLATNQLTDIAKGALTRIRQLIPSPRISIGLFDFSKSQVIFLAANFDGNPIVDDAPISFQEFGEHIIEEIQHNKSLIMNDVLNDPRAVALDFLLAEKGGIHAWLYLPLIYQGQLIGSLNFGRGPGQPFTAKDAELAYDVSNQLAIAIQQTRLYEALQVELMERKLMDERLRQSEEMYRSLFENVQVGVALTGNGKVLKYNETMLRQSGYTREEIERLENVSDFYFDLNDQHEIFQILTDQGYVKEHPVRFKKKDGAPYDTLLWMTPTIINDEPYVQVVVQDITERKQAEQALRESEEKYRTLFETANSAIMVFERTTLKIMDVNQVTCHLYGYTRDEFLRLYVSDITSEVQATTEAIRGGATHIPLRYHKKKDGTSFPVEITAAQFTLADSAVQVAFVNDITERLRRDKEREAYIEQLGRQNEELERFTYTVSHDLRNPLVTIKGFLGMLDNDLRENRQDRIQNDFQRIANAADKMQALLSDLLQLSRIGRIINPEEEIDLGKLVQEAVESLDARIQTTHAQVNIAADMPVVFGDRIRLREVLENLIDNAAKYTRGHENPVIEIGVEKRKEGNVIFVRDNGLGIDPQYHTKVFGLFEKLNPMSEGTGIGLALVKRIIEVHGGKIWVESEGLGQGANFCFTLSERRAVET